MFANEIKAQLIEGRYFLTKKEYLDPRDLETIAK